MMIQATKPAHPAVVRIAYCAMAGVLSLAMNDVVMAHDTEVQEDYDTRWRKLAKRNSVRPKDPNVYVYNSKFERNFKMPSEWTSAELVNVDAVAIRVVADYGSCSWDDARKGCESVPVRCEIDLYFDHSDHVLPWHSLAPEFWDSNYWSSSHFLRMALRKQDARKDTEKSLRSALPFVELHSGKPMVWSRLSSESANNGRRMELLSYDRAALMSSTRVSLAGACDAPPAMLVLAPDGSDAPHDTHHSWTITLPQSWQDRAAHALREAAVAAQSASVATPEK